MRGKKMGRCVAGWEEWDKPCEGNLDVLLIDGEAQVEEFELAVVSVEHVTTSGAVLTGTSYVLSEAVENGAFLGIAFGVVSVGVSDVALQRRDPVDLVGGLKRHRDHRRLGHGFESSAPKNPLPCTALPTALFYSNPALSVCVWVRRPS